MKINRYFKKVSPNIVEYQHYGGIKIKDNRENTINQSNIINTIQGYSKSRCLPIQRQIVDVKNFIKKMKDDTSQKDLFLYTYIKSDGLGDAGQLASLKSAIELRRNIYNIAKIRVIVGCEEPQDCDFIKKLLSPEEILYGPNSHKSQICDQIKWEIEYPFPSSFDMPQAYITKVREMNYPNNKLCEYTGESGDRSIGYGIPDINHELDDTVLLITLEEIYGYKIDDSMIKSIRDSIKQQCKIDTSDIKEMVLISYLKRIGIKNNDITKVFEKLPNAWLASYKKYSYGYGALADKEIDVSLISKEASKHTELLILLGSGYPTCHSSDKFTFLKMPNIPNNIMHLLLNFITNGMIFSGGEGLFVESMGTDRSNISASVMAARYNYQYQELANSLLSQEKETYTVNNDETKTILIKYGIAKYEDTYIILFNNTILNMLTNEPINLNPDCCLMVGKYLSALYLPLSLNAYPGMPQPKIFEEFDEVKEIFAKEKNRLKNKSWFNLFNTTYSIIIPRNLNIGIYNIQSIWHKINNNGTFKFIGIDNVSFYFEGKSYLSEAELQEKMNTDIENVEIKSI